MLFAWRLSLSLILLFFLTVGAGIAYAQQTIHVPQDIATIQGAINGAQAGDTVLVSPGTYNENIDFHGKAITVTSGATAFTDAATTFTILNGTTDGPVVNFGTNETSAAVLNGFTIQNGHSSVGSTLMSAGVLISVASPTVSNNVITDNVGSGIQLLNSGSPLIQGNDVRNTTGVGTSNIPGLNGNGIALEGLGNIQVIGNTIEDNVTDSLTSASTFSCGAGIIIEPDVINQIFSVLLKNNIVRNNRASCGNAGIMMPGSASAAVITLVQNLVYGNVNTIGSGVSVQVYLGGTFFSSLPTLTEINNTIYGPGTAEEIVYSFGPSIIENNVFFNTQSLANTGGFPGENSGLWCADSPAASSPLTINNNDIFNIGQLQSGGCNLGSGNLSVDPEFLNPTSENFHTQLTSPVIAAGTVGAPDVPSVDLDAKAREVCNTIDMGVYEIRPHPLIALTATPNPAPGQSTVTLTATLTGNCNTPTGSIIFLDGTTVLGTAAINSNGVAVFSTSFLFVGTHTLTATYAGDFNFENSVSNTITEVITGPPTATILNSISPNPAHSNQTVTMTATVSSAYTVPTGTVTFVAGGTTMATATVGSNGVATGVTTNLHAGTYVVTAVYSGSTEYGASTSNPITLTVLASGTTTSLSATPNPAAPGQTITLAAQVSGALAAIPLAGTVTFKDGTAILGTTNVASNGAATLGIATLLTGTHLITATYGGSSDYSTSTSVTVTVVVTGIPTSIGLNVSPNPATAGQIITMTATAIASLGTQPPSGTAMFSDQAGVLGTAPLNTGVASFTTSTLSSGTYQITATLNPTAPFAASTSAPVTEVINDFNFSLTASSTSLSLPSGDYQVLSVTVTPSGGFTDAVTFGCTSVPDHAQCVFQPQTSQSLSKGPQTVQLTVNTSDVLGYGNKVGRLELHSRGEGGSSPPLFAGFCFPSIALCGLFTCIFRRSGVRLYRLPLLIALAALSLSLEACSGKLPGETAPGTYMITMTATDAGTQTKLSQSLNLHLTVTPR